MPQPKPIASTAPPIAVAIDDVALGALRALSAEQQHTVLRCDLCGARMDEPAAASGLLLWARDEEDLRADEPPLCAECAASIATLAYVSWTGDDEASD